MLRIRSSVALLVLVCFLASALVSAIAPLADRHGAPGHDHGALTLTGSTGPGDEGAGGDSLACNHACHLLHHFQGNIEQPATNAFRPRSPAYVVAEPGVPPQRFFDTRLRPPRFPARSV